MAEKRKNGVNEAVETHDNKKLKQVSLKNI